MLREDMTVEGFLVTSDRRRGEFLLLVAMDEFVRLMREVGNDYPSTFIKVYNPDKDDYEVWQGDGDPPQRSSSDWGLSEGGEGWSPSPSIKTPTRRGRAGPSLPRPSSRRASPRPSATQTGAR
jgi:hypothetical protein